MTTLTSIERTRLALMKAGAYRGALGFCRRHRVPFDAVVGRARSPWLVRLRHQLWIIVKDSLALSLPGTARIFGVHHTTVLHAEQKQRRRLAREAAQVAA